MIPFVLSQQYHGCGCKSGLSCQVAKCLGSLKYYRCLPLLQQKHPLIKHAVNSGAVHMRTEKCYHRCEIKFVRKEESCSSYSNINRGYIPLYDLFLTVSLTPWFGAEQWRGGRVVEGCYLPCLFFDLFFLKKPLLSNLS